MEIMSYMIFIQEGNCKQISTANRSMTCLSKLSIKIHFLTFDLYDSVFVSILKTCLHNVWISAFEKFVLQIQVKMSLIPVISINKELLI